MGSLFTKIVNKVFSPSFRCLYYGIDTLQFVSWQTQGEVVLIHPQRIILKTSQRLILITYEESFMGSFSLFLTKEKFDALASKLEINDSFIFKSAKNCIFFQRNSIKIFLLKKKARIICYGERSYLSEPSQDEVKETTQILLCFFKKNFPLWKPTFSFLKFQSNSLSECIKALNLSFETVFIPADLSLRKKWEVIENFSQFIDKEFSQSKLSEHSLKEFQESWTFQGAILSLFLQNILGNQPFSSDFDFPLSSQESLLLGYLWGMRICSGKSKDVLAGQADFMGLCTFFWGNFPQLTSALFKENFYYIVIDKPISCIRNLREIFQNQLTSKQKEKILKKFCEEDNGLSEEFLIGLAIYLLREGFHNLYSKEEQEILFLGPKGHRKRLS